MTTGCVSTEVIEKHRLCCLLSACLLDQTKMSVWNVQRDVINVKMTEKLGLVLFVSLKVEIPKQT